MLNLALQELTTDVARIELTRRNAATLEAKAAEERAQLLALRGAQAVDLQRPRAKAVTEPPEERVNPAKVSNRELRERFSKEQTKGLQVGSPFRKPDADGAEAWTPSAARRRG